MLINSADFLLMTSFHEGSPQVIKEAMACNIPIVSTDVGDVKEIIGSTEGCFITDFTIESVIKAVQEVFNLKKRTNGRKQVIKYDNRLLCTDLITLYKDILDKNG